MKFSQLFSKYIIPLLALSLTFSPTGCGDQNAQQSQKKTSKKSTLTIGLIPEHNIFRQKKRYLPLAEYLTQQTDTAIKLKILPRYGNIVDNFINSKLDAAFLGSFTFTLIHSKLDIEPLARPEKIDGTSTYYGMLFTRKDSGILSAKEMKGKRFAFVDKATTAGYLLPLSYFKRQGIDNYNSWFNETYFAGTHEDAIHDVLSKKSDAGAAKNTVYYRLAREDKRIADELQIITKSPDVPENSLAVRNDLDPIIKARLKDSLLNMHSNRHGKIILEQFGAAKFIETRHEDYRAVYQFAEDIGIDIATYDYLNE